jgi:hypothetical protein
VTLGWADEQAAEKVWRHRLEGLTDLFVRRASRLRQADLVCLEMLAQIGPELGRPALPLLLWDSGPCFVAGSLNSLIAQMRKLRPREAEKPA